MGSGNHGTIKSRKENVIKAVHFDNVGRKQSELKEKETRFQEIRWEAIKPDQIGSGSSGQLTHVLDVKKNELPRLSQLVADIEREEEGDSTVVNGAP